MPMHARIYLHHFTNLSSHSINGFILPPHLLWYCGAQNSIMVKVNWGLEPECSTVHCGPWGIIQLFCGHFSDPSWSLLFFPYPFSYRCLCGGGDEGYTDTTLGCRGQRTTLGSCFSPSSTWGPGIKLRSSGLMATLLLTEPYHHFCDLCS